VVFLDRVCKRCWSCNCHFRQRDCTNNNATDPSQQDFTNPPVYHIAVDMPKPKDARETKTQTVSLEGRLFENATLEVIYMVDNGIVSSFTNLESQIGRTSDECSLQCATQDENLPTYEQAVLLFQDGSSHAQ